MKLAQIEQVDTLLMHGKKQYRSVGEKKQRRSKNTVYYKGLGMGCFTKKVKSSLRYDFALKPESEDLFIWGFTSLSTLYRSYHDE